MKITGIRIYKTDLPYADGAYVWGAGNAIEVASASVVVIDTDAGLQGCGEFTQCGENYMVAHSEGVEAFARIAAPKLLGEDPRQVARIEQTMDHVVQGHGYAAAPFDAACWDILGQACDQPVWMLLGGKLTDGAPMYRVVLQKPTEEALAELERYRMEGYRQFQVNVSVDWQADNDWIRAGVDLPQPGEIATTAVAHIAASTPSECLQNTTDLLNCITRSKGIGGAWAENGNPSAPDTPGLGVTPDVKSLGAPVAEYVA